MPLTQKSFSKGSSLPPLTKGTLRLYTMRFCPYAQRARLVIAHKNIKHETVNINLKEKPDWFLERNPKGSTPVLEQDGRVLYESLVVCTYLDDVFPEKPLTPADPYQRGRDSLLIDFNQVNMISNYYKLLNSKGADADAKEAMKKGMQKLEDDLIARGGPFFGGETPMMIDFVLWPHFERYPFFERFNFTFFPTESLYPTLHGWIQKMRQQPAVKATCYDLDTHTKFLMSKVDGTTPDYDYGLDD